MSIELRGEFDVFREINDVSETFATKILRFLPLPFTTIVPRETIDVAKFLSFPPGFHGTNPSIVPVGDGYLVAVRGVNHVYVKNRVGNSLAFTAGDDYENVSRFALLDRDLKLVRALPKLDATFRDMEDIRLFRFHDSIMAVANADDPVRGPKSRAMTVLTIAPDFGSGSVRHVPSPYGFNVEKNWAPFVLGGILYFVYSFAPLVILRYDAENGTATSAEPRFAKVPPAALRFLIAGSSAGIAVEGGFLFATHRRTLSIPLRHMSYVHRMAYLDAATFELRAGPYFSIGERTIQFINGLALDDDEFVVSFGIMDSCANLARIPRAAIVPATFAKRNFEGDAGPKKKAPPRGK